jgi:hypothetical protein
MAAIGGLIHDVQMVTWGQPVLDASIDVARSARSSLNGEYFVLLEQGGVDAVRDAYQVRGVPGSALVTAHPQSVQQAEGVMGAQSRYGLYGQLSPTTTPRQFIHTKTLSANGDDPEHAKAILASGSLSDDTKWRWEVAGVVTGKPARALHHLAASAVSGDLAYMRTAIARANVEGIYLNDPVVGSTGLTDAIMGLVHHENADLTIAMKSVFDEQFATAVAARKAAGVDVRIITKRIDEPSERILREAGVPLLKPDGSKPEIHGNAMVAGGLGQAYWGTAYASPRTFAQADVPNLYAGGGRLLSPSAQWERSREIGALTDDAQAITDLRRGIAEMNAQPYDFRGEVIRPVQP